MRRRADLEEKEAEAHLEALHGCTWASNLHGSLDDGGQPEGRCAEDHLIRLQDTNRSRWQRTSERFTARTWERCMCLALVHRSEKHPLVANNHNNPLCGTGSRRTGRSIPSKHHDARTLTSDG